MVLSQAKKSWQEKTNICCYKSPNTTQEEPKNWERTENLINFYIRKEFDLAEYNLIF